MAVQDPDFNMKKIGSRIRKFRKQSEMSMKELAGLLDISVSYLSLIENGKVNMNVVMLYDVVRVLNIPSVTDLISDFTVSPVNIIRRDARKTIMYGEDIRQDFLCATKEHQLEVTALHLGPGTRSKPVYHQGDELCYVLTGRIKLHLNDGLEEYILDKDDAAEYSAVIPHQFENIGTETASLLLAVTPVAF